MSGVASKNLYELLGNDDDGDDTPPTAPKIVDKKVTSTKRTGPVEASEVSAPRRRGPGGNEEAFRDRNIGRDNNRARPTDETGFGGRGGGGRGARVRGGRGSSNARPYNDRHPRNRAPGSEKQGDQAWGATEGQAELKDEQAGEQIAQAEKTEATVEGEDETKPEEEAAEPAEPAEPEPKVVTLDDYLADLAEKQAHLGEHNIRNANEGSKVDKKWADLKAYSKDEEEFMAGTGAKPQRTRERRKDKEMITLDNTYHEPPERRAPRGDGRGGRGGRGERSEYRGGRGRGDGAPRPARGSDGAPRPARGSDGPRPSRGGDGYRGSRGGPRGGRGRDSEAPNTESQTDFPALGA